MADYAAPFSRDLFVGSFRRAQRSGARALRSARGRGPGTGADAARALVDDGVASYEDVDRAWMIAVGTPAGPFGLMDMVGLDVVWDIETVYYRESGDASDAPPQLLLDKIARGELGVKTGKGFYRYPHPAFQTPGWLKGDED
jgi:3-hydroxyacyl-CoA dehydrogenase